ncbi:MAG: type II toxin-antitoxin system VapC family toxin [Candidatus Cloacimonetes bacterium]|nr:type II toxin-antitoxin system VapC family toxin [Candidatus Cloacimonadota bacterium]
MSTKVYSLQSYVFTPGEKVLLDANIWLYLFPAPISINKALACKYSEAFKRLCEENAQPLLDPMVLSEYLNRYCRIEYDATFQKKFKDYKGFRKSDDFLGVSTSAHNFAKKILKFCKFHSVSISNLNFDQALEEFQSGKTDFNDAVLADICRKGGFKFMTHDGDFKYSGIDILTVNPRLLA